MATALLLQAWLQDEFSPTTGQVSFVLSQAPTDPTSLFFVVNGVDYDDVSDFTVSGATVTWLDTDFSFRAGTDKVLIRYQ